MKGPQLKEFRLWRKWRIHEVWGFCASVACFLLKLLPSLSTHDRISNINDLFALTVLFKSRADLTFQQIAVLAATIWPETVAAKADVICQPWQVIVKQMSKLQAAQSEWGEWATGAVCLVAGCTLGTVATPTFKETSLLLSQSLMPYAFLEGRTYRQSTFPSSAVSCLLLCDMLSGSLSVVSMSSSASEIQAFWGSQARRIRSRLATWL